MQNTLSAIRILVLIAIIVLMVVGCKKSEDTKSGVTGHVGAAEGNGNGAIVRLFEAPDPFLDVSVWSVPDQHNGVGFPYGLEFTYDPRTERPLLLSTGDYAIDTADGNGDFQFDGIVAGDYIVSAEKPGQGWTIPRLLSTSGGDVNVGTIELPRVVTYDQVTVLDENTTWESGTHYVLNSNLFVDDGVTLTIEPGAVVCLGGNKALNIDGTLVCRGTPDNFIIFTSADVINRDPDEWSRIQFNVGAAPPNMAYCDFRYGDTAIDTDVDSGLVEYCHFNRFVGFGIQTGETPPTVNRCVFERTANGVRAASSGGMLIEHSVFQTCDPFAVVVDSVHGGEIFCNWFRDCGGSDTSEAGGNKGVIKMDLVTDFEVHQNTFETSWFGFQMGSWVDSSVEIHHNIFTRMNRCFNISVTEERRGPSNPTCTYNCFTTIDLSVLFIHCSQHNYLDMDATHNFWNTNSISVIENDYVHDHLDDPQCPTVFLEPIMTSCGQILTETGIPAGVCQ